MTVGRKYFKRHRHRFRHKTRSNMEEYGIRNEVLLLLGFKDYPTYLRSKLWKIIRERKLSADPNCFACFQPAIQVHHGSYDHAVLIGESDKDLYSVCQGCHLKCEVTRSGYKRSVLGATNELKRMRRIHLSLKHIRHDNRIRIVMARR